MLCEKTKHKKSNKLIKVESDKFCEKIEKICNEKRDHGLRVKIGGDFSKLLLLEAHYHKNIMLCMSNLLNLKVMMQTVYMIWHLKTLQVNGIEILPLNPEDISLAAMQRVVPQHLKHFLQCLCEASEHKLLKILSIAQRIIFVSSDLQKKIPKQVDSVYLSLQLWKEWYPSI